MQGFNVPDGISDWAYIVTMIIFVVANISTTVMTNTNVKKFKTQNTDELSIALGKTADIKNINKEIEHSKKCDADIKRDLEQAKSEHGEIQGDQQAIKQILAEVQASQKRQEEAQERTELRQEIFAPTTSREMHEHQLELRDRYVSIHGNGAGRIRLQLLEDDYRRRLSSPDQSSAWNYPD